MLHGDRFDQLRTSGANPHPVLEVLTALATPKTRQRPLTSQLSLLIPVIKITAVDNPRPRNKVAGPRQ